MNNSLNILVIDCFDSFTYNLVHYLEPFAHKVSVLQVDKFNNDILEINDAIVLSPGHGLPSDYPILNKIILNSNKPILGICLGMQAIIEAFGGSLINLDCVWHGIARETVLETNDSLFKNLPQKIYTGRYHSWVAKNIPECFKVIATDIEGYAMAISHKKLPIKAVQFHPESILTPYGKHIIKNWIKLFR